MGYNAPNDEIRNTLREIPNPSAPWWVRRRYRHHSSPDVAAYLDNLADNHIC
jgi:hypothetical protein